MSQLTKSESARINGAKSRGAVTPQGRLNSSMNAASHGLTARTLILQNEDKAQFLEILNAYYEYLQPRGLNVHFHIENGGFVAPDAAQTPAGANDVRYQVDLDLV